MVNRGGFSWKRAVGITRAKQRISRATGIPLTRSGRQRKIGKLLTGGCVVIPGLFFLILVAATAVLIFALAGGTMFSGCGTATTRSASGATPSSPESSVLDTDATEPATLAPATTATTAAPSPPTGANAGRTTTSTTYFSPDALIVQAGSQIEAALELPAGAVSLSSDKPALPGSDVVLKWEGGRAELDFQEGGIRAILVDSPVRSSPMPALPDSRLDAAASQAAGLLGWDAAAIAADGFTSGEALLGSHVPNVTEYSKTWVGHDPQGIPNQGLIQVNVDAGTGKLLRFFFDRGPTSILDMSAAISKDNAILIAKKVNGDRAQVSPTVTGPGESAKPDNTTTASIGVVARSAELVHSDAPGITGGRDMLVWIVELGGSTANGIVSVTIYLDAVTGLVLSQAWAG